MFQRARLTLTAWYLLSIMTVSITFSIIIFFLMTMELDRFWRNQRFRIQNRLEQGLLFPDVNTQMHMPSGPLVDPDLVYETEHRIFLMLVTINVGIFGLSGVLSYLLAGKTLSPIQDMVEDQKDFISNASHELRTPLTSLKTSLEVNLRDKKLTMSEAKQIMTENVEEVNRLQRLTDSLLDLSYFQKPEETLEFREVDLLEVITAAVKQVKPMAKKKLIRIKTEPAHIQVEANSVQIEHLLVTLLDNAIKYSPEKTVVSLQVFEKRKDYMIIISDQGIGISQEDVPRIFDRFFRSDKARSHSDKAGYGLGLAIAREIVVSHHGSISVSSVVDQGTTFTIKLPKLQKRKFI